MEQESAPPKPLTMGAIVHPARYGRDTVAGNGRFAVWAADPRQASMGPMHRNPLVNFHRSAEAAGYPALLIVAMVSLGLVVTPVLLLGVTRAVWVLGLALLSIVLALAILAVAIEAAFGAADEPADRSEDAPTAAKTPRDPTAPPTEHAPQARQERPHRRAA
jgi:hypothetical protein